VPLGVTLLELRRELRAETGTSLNPNQGVQAQDTIDILLARQQRELWDAYNWQHLRIWTDMPLDGGQALYDYPKEMAFDQIVRVYIAQVTKDDVTDPNKITAATSWTPLTYGIKAFMMNLGPTNVGTPKRWSNVATVDVSGPVPITNPIGQFQVLPTPEDTTITAPNTSYVIRFEGLAPLSPLVAPTDTCILDSKAIVMFTAAEILATQKSEAAPMKLTKAQNYLRRLLADQGADKRQNYNMGGNQRGGNDPDKMGRRTAYLDYIPG
jgi:hypothetical protein